MWSIEEQTNAVRERAEKAMRIPVGMASPLWFAFGAAASMGVTWWWMTRWTKAVNIEAAMPPIPVAANLVVVKSASQGGTASEPAPTSIAEAAKAATAPEAVAAPEPEPASVRAKRASVVDALPEPGAPLAEPDDLTRLVGIGPKLADALAARGVTRFSELAAWTADDLATIDAALSLKGRAVRDAWVAQAKRFAAASVH